MTSISLSPTPDRTVRVVPFSFQPSPKAKTQFVHNRCQNVWFDGFQHPAAVEFTHNTYNLREIFQRSRWLPFRERNKPRLSMTLSQTGSIFSGQESFLSFFSEFHLSPLSAAVGAKMKTIFDRESLSFFIRILSLIANLEA
jgi:hypothetical protein